LADDCGDGAIKLSLVVPLYNEADNVSALHGAISSALAGLGANYEIVFVDDGSKDDTFRLAADRVALDPRLRVVRLARNYGQTAAMAAGIQESRGTVIVTMDGDLQNDPADVPRLLALIDEGFDIVVGWRRKRRDGTVRVFVSKVANQIMTHIMGVRVRDSGCSLKAFRSELIKSLPLYGEMHRFIPALSTLAGARLAQIEVNHHPRRFGVSKYGFSRIYKVMLDIISIRMLLSYAWRPFLWHSTMTMIACVIGLILVLAGFGIEQGRALVVQATVGMLFLSLALFLVAWGLIGLLMASSDRRIARFASLAADLNSRLKLAEKEPRHGS
jgi:glycosyltransferase involved in cell wall biosynthesis